MQEVRERIDGFPWVREIRAKVYGQVDLEAWLYFVVENNTFERNFQFNIAFSRIAKEEF
jgi:hypothetical protein